MFFPKHLLGELKYTVCSLNELLYDERDKREFHLEKAILQLAFEQKYDDRYFYLLAYLILILSKKEYRGVKGSALCTYALHIDNAQREKLKTAINKYRRLNDSRAKNFCHWLDGCSSAQEIHKEVFAEVGKFAPRYNPDSELIRA